MLRRLGSQNQHIILEQRECRGRARAGTHQDDDSAGEVHCRPMKGGARKRALWLYLDVWQPHPATVWGILDNATLGGSHGNRRQTVEGPH